MDIVTHGMMGVLIARTIPTGHRRSMITAALIGALAPDLDAAARLWNPIAAITVHRTATHSLLGGGIVAMVVAGLMRGVSRESFLRLFGVTYLGILSHIGLDLLTSFGTAILWPLTDRRFALAQHYVVDPIFTALILAFLIATFRPKGIRTSLTRISLAGIVLYVLVTGAHQWNAFSRWQGIMESQGIRPIRSIIIPLFPGPFRWLGVSETEEAFYQQSFWLYGSDPGPLRLFSKTNEDLGEMERLKEVKLFLNFARFPWSHIWSEGSFRIVEYRDLAFADHPLGVLGGPLSLRVWVDESGSVRKVELGHLF
ncbi:MAG: metal-dependent hydrolase [Candidatus Binatia bacterium]